MPDSDREHMSFVDHAWLRMDRPYNHMTICAVTILADRIDLERLQKHIATRWVLPYKRFQQRPVYHPTGAYWETDIHFEIGNHVRRVGLPGAQGKEELEEFISNLVSTPMDPTKPLWDIHLVEDYRGGSAVIWRFHHCIADGIALIHVLLSATAKAPGAATNTARPSARKAAHEDEEESRGNIFRQLFDPVSAAVSHVVKTGRDLVEEGVDIVLHPSETVGYARQGIGLVSSVAKQGLGFASETARLLLLADDPQTRFRGKLGVAKRVAWAEPLPLDEVKTIGKALGCTVNDVLLSSVAGALRTYLVEKGDPLDPKLEIRAAVPVNLRSWEQAKNLGNAFGLVLLTLPIGIENPLERLHKVHKRMGELKSSYQAILTFGLLEILGLGPKVAQASAIRMLSKKATATMTNVPGPQEPMYLEGCKIAEMMFWVPQSGSVGMGVSIQSYNNRVHFGLMTDQKLVKDPEAIVSQFSREFEKLVLLTLMGGWEKRLDAKAIATAE
jgi:WS/DGAT/MGAT family acyltransferase